MESQSILIASKESYFSSHTKLLVELLFPMTKVHALTVQSPENISKPQIEPYTLVIFDVGVAHNLSALPIKPNISSHHWLAILENKTDEAVLQCIDAGFSGAVSRSRLQETISPALRSLRNDELWFSRKVLSLALNNYRKKTSVHQWLTHPMLENAQLTTRERQLSQLLIEGRRNKEIASQLHISLHTVKSHISHILKKFGVESRQELQAKLLTRLR